ncbi:MAG: acyl carrier protein [Xanthobacteraceae bacterium]|nr:acyl carrier protein [Xanthobacteraceae bacterium]
MLAMPEGRSDIETVLYPYLTTRFPALGDCHADTPLLESGAIDSLGILELMTFLGERFGITLEDGDFDPEFLGTPGRLVTFIQRKRQ